jgi:hypothetical protein
MIETIIAGVKENLFLVGFSLLMLIGGTIASYKKFGLKRVLLGKKHDHRELIYRRKDNSIIWKETLISWKIILTGGMSLLTIFLIIMLLSLSFIYKHDIQATRENNYKLCQAFGTTEPTPDQLENYYGEPGLLEENLKLDLEEIYNEGDK